jgi:hypothetical protein
MIEFFVISISLSAGHYIAKKEARKALPAHAARAGAAAVQAYKIRVAREEEERERERVRVAEGPRELEGDVLRISEIG